MRTLTYNFHDLIRVRISGVSRFTLKDLNTKFHFFEDLKSSAAPQIEIEIGDFTPDLAGCHTVDQNYFVRKNYLFWTDSDKGLKWKAEIRGVEDQKTSIRFGYDWRNRLHWPWLFFPDWILHTYVLQPFLERRFHELGFYLLHAAAVSRENQAVIFIGRGQTYKTTLALRMMKQGYELLGDDFVLLGPDRVLSFPTSPLWLEFTSEQLRDERLSLADQFRLASFLRTHKQTRLRFAREAKIDRAFILLAKDGGGPDHLDDLSQEHKKEMILTNQLLESNTYVAYRYRIGQYLEAYDLATGKTSHDEARLRSMIRKTFEAVPVELLRIPKDFDENIMHSILREPAALLS